MKNARFWGFSRKVELILAPYESIRWKGLKGSKESIFLKFRIKKIWSFRIHENLRFLGFFEKFWKFEFFSLVRVDICYIWIYKVRDIKINWLLIRARSSTSYSRRKPGWRLSPVPSDFHPKMVLLLKLLDMFRELKTIFHVTKYCKVLHNGCLKFWM